MYYTHEVGVDEAWFRGTDTNRGKRLLHITASRAPLLPPPPLFPFSPSFPYPTLTAFCAPGARTASREITLEQCNHTHGKYHGYDRCDRTPSFSFLRTATRREETTTSVNLSPFERSVGMAWFHVTLSLRDAQPSSSFSPVRSPFPPAAHARAGWRGRAGGRSRFLFTRWLKPRPRAFLFFFRTMTAICFVCNLPILSHQVGLIWQGGNGWDDLVREQVEESTLKQRLGTAASLIEAPPGVSRHCVRARERINRRTVMGCTRVRFAGVLESREG